MEITKRGNRRERNVDHVPTIEQNRKSHWAKKKTGAIVIATDIPKVSRDNYDMRTLRPSSFATTSLNYIHVSRGGPWLGTCATSLRIHSLSKWLTVRHVDEHETQHNLLETSYYRRSSLSQSGRRYHDPMGTQGYRGRSQGAKLDRPVRRWAGAAVEAVAAASRQFSRE